MVWYSEIRSPTVSCFIVVTKEIMPSSTVRPFSLLKRKNNGSCHSPGSATELDKQISGGRAHPAPHFLNLNTRTMST